MTDFLLLAFIFLCAGVLAVPVASRFGLGSVLGYLIAGILISPLLALFNVDVIAIQHFAEFGVVMMLFLVGLELEPKLLWEMRQKLIGLGGIQVSLTAAIITGVVMYVGQPWPVALAIGMVLSLSSTAIILQTLDERNLMNSDGGKASFSVLLFQDIIVIPMIAIIPLLALPDLADQFVQASLPATDQPDKHDHGLSLVEGLSNWQRALVTFGAIAFVIVGGSSLVGPLLRFIAIARLRELFTAAALMVVIAIALLMSLVGISPALGTFLAGVVLANSEFKHELESNINPFKGLLLGLFFMTVGAGINFALLIQEPILIAAITLSLMALKALIVYGIASLFRMEGSNRWLFSLGLAQAGEFGFVLLSLAVASKVIPTPIADKLLLVVALSMLLTPLLYILYDRLIAAIYAEGQTPEADHIDETGDIIIAGHGEFGGIVNRMLRNLGYNTTVVDFSSANLQKLRAFGLKVYFGDASRPDLLHAAGIEKAKMLIIAIDGREQITELARHVLSNYPKVHIVARAVDRTHVYDLWALGCRDIIRDTYDSSIRAGRSALEALGNSPRKADRLASKFEEMDRQAMIDLAHLHDINIPMHENAAYVAKATEILKQHEQELIGHWDMDDDPEPILTPQEVPEL
jgi:CPA2 family monovalent cation:H+ antiporter-2